MAGSDRDRAVERVVAMTPADHLRRAVELYVGPHGQYTDRPEVLMSVQIELALAASKQKG